MAVATAVDGRETLDLATLEHALRRAEPAAVLLPSWLLESLIAADRGLRGPLFSIPHDRSHVIDRGRLVDLVADEDFRLPVELPEEPVLTLLARPDNDWLQETPAAGALLAYWRLLFHATVDARLRARRVDGTLDAAAVQARIERLGRAAFREGTFVLVKEHALPAGADDAEAYAEFASTFLELSHFAPWLLPWYFPAADPERVRAVLAEDVDGPETLAQTRLSGAADPAESARAHRSTDEAPPAPQPPAPEVEHSNRKGKSLMRAALAAEARGNDVAAAILRVRAARVTRGTRGAGSGGGGGGLGQPARLRAGAVRRIDALASRLQVALELDDADFDPWRGILRGLLNRADAGWWNNERRLLYDLQKVCVCHEREVYSANVVEWVLDRGRRPLRRPQPAQRLVTAHKALRSAETRAAKARLHPHERVTLRRLLHAAVGRAARRLRTELRPAVIQALEEGDLVPTSAVERVAQGKLVDELLDGVERRGYLNLGNLRDAVSRNQLKLDDVAGPRELLGRDQLLRVDRRLEWQLDGVYHRGEIYLRLFQRLSSVLFGSAAGRFVTRVLLIPGLGAFVVLEGLDHMVGQKVFHQPPKTFRPIWAVLALALLIFCLVNWPAFRGAVARGARAMGRGLRALFVDFPRWLGGLPLVRFLFSSRLVRLFFRYAVKPLALSAIALPLLPDRMRPGVRGIVLVGLYLAFTLALNSPPGRALEQTILHALRVTLPRMTWEILLGLFRIVMSAFKRLLEGVDRALYAVDEWLRFGASQGRWAVAAKAVLGVFWFFIAYVTRFVVNLLVEPQINPIKHFPVVTVSHKFILPTAYPMATAFEKLGMEGVRAGTLAGAIVTCIPGVFGFLAWELKENWKLYRANRPRVLKPARVGSHGETFAQLLRPGFHSGTVPKLFARVRRSVQHGRPRAGEERRVTEAAHHVEHDVTAFVERELVALLNRSPFWTDTPVSVDEVDLAVTRIRVRLRCDALGPEPAVLSFEQRDGLILAAVDEPGWMPALPATKAELLRAALVGFYKLAAVDVVAEHVRAAFAPATAHFDVRRRALVVWRGERFEDEHAYDLAEPSDETRRLLLRETEVPWPLWKELWDARTPAEVANLAAQVAGGVHVLPPGCVRCPDVVGETGADGAPVEVATRVAPLTPARRATTLPA